MSMREHVKDQIDIQLGMLEIQVKALRVLKDKTENSFRAAGIQDAIDILEEAILTGLSITNQEIDGKERNSVEKDVEQMCQRLLTNPVIHN